MPNRRCDEDCEEKVLKSSLGRRERCNVTLGNAPKGTHGMTAFQNFIDITDTQRREQQ